MSTMPDFPGMIFHPWRGHEDSEAIYSIIHGCKEVDSIDPYSTLENLPSLDEIQGNFADSDPHDTIIVEVNDQPVGYNQVIWWTEAGGLTLYLHLGYVLPSFRGQGIGTALLGWSEARIRTLATEQGGDAAFGANASSTEHSAARLLLDNGYQPLYSLAQMEYLIPDDLKALPIPEGIEIRSPQPDDAEKMWQGRLAAYSAIPLVGSSAPDESEITELQKEIEESGHLWRTAWAGDTIAAEIRCSISDFMGSKTGIMDEVYTAPKFQRKGIGQALVNHVLLMFKTMQVVRIRLHTLDDNRRGAKTFYEKAGFKTLKTFPRYRKPL